MRMKWCNGGVKKRIVECVFATAIILQLTGCGGGAPIPPENYSTEQDSLPALNSVVELDADSQFDEELNDEDDALSYVYSGLLSGSKTAETYVQILVDEYGCVLLTTDAGERASDDMFSSESGEALIAVESESGSGLFELILNWDENSCVVTPVFAEDAELPEENTAMTLEEMVQYLQQLPPDVLGLDEADMSAYQIFAEDGLVLLDGEPCVSLNVYLLDTHQIEGTYLIVGHNNEVYRLDRATGKAVQVYP